MICDNGDAVEIGARSMKCVPGYAPAGEVFVDGYGVGDVGAVVLRDRKLLADEGMVVVVMTLSAENAQLISGPEDAAAESLRLETLLPQIPALHPQAQRLAKDAIALLQTAFRVSQELMCSDAHASEQDAPEGAYRYFLQETWQPARMRCSYGLLGQQRQSGCWTTLAVISPFSDDRAAVERLAKLCTAQQLALRGAGQASAQEFFQPGDASAHKHHRVRQPRRVAEERVQHKTADSGLKDHALHTFVYWTVFTRYSRCFSVQSFASRTKPPALGPHHA